MTIAQDTKPSDALAAFLARHATPYDPAGDTYRRPPFAAPVKASKATPIYNAHSYHTKVPPQGIVPYIQHYTDPGDLVLDPFCGSGMTGVAALMSGRHAILNDLSPAATHIAYNYCTPVDVEALKREFERIREAVREEFDWLYGTTCDRCGGPATIQYTIWSDILACARCGEELVLWDVAVDRESGKIRDRFTCPTCGKEQGKKGLRRIRSVPVLTNYECLRCRPSRTEHPTTETEKLHLAKIETTAIPYWYPTDEFPLGRQTRKIRQGTAGISRVDEICTRRNLWALARLWHECAQVKPQRLAEALQFVVTAVIPTSTRMYRYRTVGGGGPSGNLYVSSLNLENNVGDLLRAKFKHILGAIFQWSKGAVPEAYSVVRNGTASVLLGIQDNTVDYIFTDPPFGSNLQYAELNFLWESWLREFTNWSQDCVMNYVHGKGLAFYREIMTQAFSEMYRVLKPGRWASVVFHNTDDAVWRGIQEGAQEAGFDVVNAMAFDKGQGTFNQVNMGKDSAAGFDVVLNLIKPRLFSANGKATPVADIERQVVEAVAAHLAGNPLPEHRTTQFLHSLTIRHLLSANILIEKVAIPYLEETLPHYFKQVEGHWYLRGEQIVGQSTFVLKTETDAITWLQAVLSESPQTAGDIVPQWQIATLEANITKPLDQILAENFWLDEPSGRWRVPTEAERRRLSAKEEVAAQAHLRVVRRYLAGDLDRRPGDVELCAWIRFCYSREFFAEAVALFGHLDESRVEPEELRQVRKIVEVSRLRVGR